MNEVRKALRASSVLDSNTAGNKGLKNIGPDSIQKVNMENLVSELGLSDEGLHNAGMDASRTLEATIVMAVRSDAGLIQV